jgi:predicted nucleic acid-binding protein
MAVLETTFVIDLMKESKRGRPGPASRKLEELVDRGLPLRIAIFTLAELFVGVAKGTRPRQERAAIQECVAPLDILPFEWTTAEIFGLIVGGLEKRGESISDIDALIASVAVEYSEMLVTRNRRHFDRIPGLEVEDY